jgi:hypothetical protein
MGFSRRLELEPAATSERIALGHLAASRLGAPEAIPAGDVLNGRQAPLGSQEDPEVLSDPRIASWGSVAGIARPLFARTFQLRNWKVVEAPGRPTR